MWSNDTDSLNRIDKSAIISRTEGAKVVRLLPCSPLNQSLATRRVTDPEHISLLFHKNNTTFSQFYQYMVIQLWEFHHINCWCSRKGHIKCPIQINNTLTFRDVTSQLPPCAPRPVLKIDTGLTGEIPKYPNFAGLTLQNKAAQKKYTLTDGIFKEYILVFWERFGVKNRVDPLFKRTFYREIIVSVFGLIFKWT